MRFMKYETQPEPAAVNTTATPSPSPPIAEHKQYHTNESISFTRDTAYEWIYVPKRIVCRVS